MAEPKRSSRRTNPNSTALAPNAAIVRKVKNVAKGSAFPPRLLCIAAIETAALSAKPATITKTSQASVPPAKPANIHVIASKVSDASMVSVQRHAIQRIVASASAARRDKLASPHAADKKPVAMKVRLATQRAIASQGSPAPTANVHEQASLCTVAKTPTAQRANAAKTEKAATIFANNNKPAKPLVIATPAKPATAASASPNRSLSIVATSPMLAPQVKCAIAPMGNATNAPRKSNAKALVTAPKAKTAKMAVAWSTLSLSIVADWRDARPTPNAPTPMDRKERAAHLLAKAMPTVEDRLAPKRAIAVAKSGPLANAGSAPTASTKARAFATPTTELAALKANAKSTAIALKAKPVSTASARSPRPAGAPHIAASSRDAPQANLASNPTEHAASAPAPSARSPKTAAHPPANLSEQTVSNLSPFAMIPVNAALHAVLFRSIRFVDPTGSVAPLRSNARRLAIAPKAKTV